MAGIIAFCLAALVAGRGVLILVRERRRVGRLVRITARLTHNGMRTEWVTNQFQQNDTQPAQRLETVHTLEWAYEVGGASHTGTRNSPVPLSTERPPAMIEVLYDRADPTISRLPGETPGTEATPWFIFAAVILAVGLGIEVISRQGG